MKSSATKRLFTKDNGWYFATAIVFVFISLILCGRTLRTFPAYIHAWAQSDWYAIAQGFVNNGYDLFHPETMIYNKQFPGTWSEAYETTITSADFPIHEYIVALLMGLTGSRGPWVFRCWTLAVSLMGLWFLFLAFKRLTKSWTKSTGLTLMAIASPVYAYYMAGFIPSIPSLALVMAGLWAYIKYYQENRCSYWHLAIGLLTLAAMIRTSQLVVLVAVCGFELLRVIRKESTFWNKLPSVVIGFAAIGGYMLWNAHLKAEHGTLFLSSLMPPRNGEDWEWVIETVRERWLYSYYGLLQQIVIAVVAAGALITLAVRRFRQKEFRKEGQQERLSLSWLVAIWLVGEAMFVVAMWRQFSDHDYYILDSLWLPVLVTTGLIVSQWKIQKRAWKIAEGTVCALLCGLMVWNARTEIDKRNSGWDLAMINIWHYQDSDKWLDELGVSRDAKILSLVSYPQNSPFLMMGRKGYSVMWFGEDQMDVSYLTQHALKFPFDYIVVEDYAVREYFERYNPFMSRIVRLEGTGELSLCTLADTVVNQTADNFFNRPQSHTLSPQCRQH